MIITPLGHTEFLLDIANPQGKNVRICVDIWLSDFVVGDMMERAVKVRLDTEKLSTIDIIYISHSHTDHLDPYTLISIYEHADPILLLPYTLAFMVPLIREYIPDIRIEILSPHQIFHYEGIEIMGHMFPQNTITNEDDVMMLSVDAGRELLFAEIDTLPEEDDLEIQRELYRILTKKEYETVCYLASRNELPGQLPLLDLPLKKRRSFRDEYIAARKEEIYFSYQKWEYEEYADFPNIFQIPHLVRGFIGQGIVYPKSLSMDISRVQIFPLDMIASMESDIARECGYDFPQRALLPGRQYKAEFGTLESGRKECPIGILSIDHEKGNLETTDVRLYASGPLFPRDIADLDSEKQRILDILHTRFLPYWSASPVASLRSALIKNPDGCYRIGFKTFVIPGSHQDLEGINSGFLPTQEGQLQWMIFEYSMTRSGFIEVSYDPQMKLDEEYWLLDVLDFLEGRQELYSNFWHRLDPKMVYRLWTCLGANFCNNDLVLKKYELHFEGSKQGRSVNDFIGNALRKITTP